MAIVGGYRQYFDFIFLNKDAEPTQRASLEKGIGPRNSDNIDQLLVVNQATNTAVPSLPEECLLFKVVKHRAMKRRSGEYEGAWQTHG